jgi:hypothetical protein
MPITLHLSTRATCDGYSDCRSFRFSRRLISIAAVTKYVQVLIYMIMMTCVVISFEVFAAAAELLEFIVLARGVRVP